MLAMRRVRRVLRLWTVLVFVFLYLPIALLVIYSFNNSNMNLSWEGFTCKWYRALWSSDPGFLAGIDANIRGNIGPLVDALKNSVIIAAAVTVLSVVLGTAGSWLLYRFRYRFQGAIRTLAFVPVVVPEVIMGISLLLLFAACYPIVHLGLGFTTVIIAHVTFCFPFVMIGVDARLAGLDPSLEEAAMDLGATPWQAFWRVIVPYLLPAIISGALMAFTLSMDELLVTWFVYSSQSITLPVKIYGMARIGLNPMLNAVSTLFIVGTALLVVVAEMVKKIGRPVQ